MSRVDARIEALLGALLAPIAFTGYYVLVGTPRLPEPLGPYHASPSLWAFYLGPLAALGAIAVGYRTRLTASATLATLALIGLPFYAPSALHGSLLAVNFPALFALVVVLLVAIGEWSIRYPDRARAVFTPRSLRIGLAVGVAHAVVAMLLRSGVFGFELVGSGLVSVGIALWMLGGAILTGATPGFLYARYGLVGPALVVAGLFGSSAWSTWQYLVDLQESGAAMAAAFTPFTGYLVTWFAVVAIAIGVGWTELQLK